MSMPASPGTPTPPQGTAGGTDIVVQLQGIVRQLSSSNTNASAIISALQAINFPQNVKGYTVAGLPSSPTIGTVAYVTDGTSGLSWGNTVTGGHSTKYLVWYNGAAWTVVGS